MLTLSQEGRRCRSVIIGKTKGDEMASRGTALDASAVGLSTLCLVHCLALPILAVSLPLAGALAENEWIHRALVLIVVPITGLAIWQAFPKDRVFILGAVLGVAILLASAFVEALHDHETLLTTIGALILAGAHIWRWRNRHG